jgi:predicted HTH transcriptional regulator
VDEVDGVVVKVTKLVDTLIEVDDVALIKLGDIEDEKLLGEEVEEVTKLALTVPDDNVVKELLIEDVVKEEGTVVLLLLDAVVEAKEVVEEEGMGVLLLLDEVVEEEGTVVLLLLGEVVEDISDKEVTLSLVNELTETETETVVVVIGGDPALNSIFPSLT